MAERTVERQNLIEAVNALPDEVLIELASFLEYLSYKTGQHRSAEPSQQNFLLTVVGLGKSGQTDISESDEEILRSEINPTYGWSTNQGNSHDSHS